MVLPAASALVDHCTKAGLVVPSADAAEERTRAPRTARRRGATRSPLREGQALPVPAAARPTGRGTAGWLEREAWRIRARQALGVELTNSPKGSPSSGSEPNRSTWPSGSCTCIS